MHARRDSSAFGKAAGRALGTPPRRAAGVCVNELVRTVERDGRARMREGRGAPTGRPGGQGQPQPAGRVRVWLGECEERVYVRRRRVGEGMGHGPCRCVWVMVDVGTGDVCTIHWTTGVAVVASNSALLLVGW